MKLPAVRATLAAILTLWMLSPVLAQQKAAPQPAPAIQAPLQAAPAPAPVQPATPPAAAQASPQTDATPATQAAPAPATSTPAADPVSKLVISVPKELSPWSMFMSADVVVKAVMIGLAFASLITWTVFIAKMIELSVIQRKVRSALNRISDVRSLSEAQFALGSKQGVLPALLAACMREARLSAGISSDGGIKERAASSCAEIVRAESRRVRIGMGLLATIGATSPFVGLFGTVWGIMNSFIGISKAQTTNLAVVAPGIAEALLATAIGLVAAIPAVIIYNHFARVTKGYIELVNRASGAAARLLSRDLDRTHVSSHSGSHSRAAE